MHPLARATLVKKVVSGSVPEFMSLVVEWLQSRYKPLSLGAMLCDLEHGRRHWTPATLAKWQKAIDRAP